MTARAPPSLLATLIELDSKEFEAIGTWSFQEPFVNRLLEDDIPQRVLFNDCYIWTYRDPNGGSLVGFGTLDICTDCSQFTAGQRHPYIPLLAVNPNMTGRGFGTSIIQHLIDEAAIRYQRVPGCHDVVFLDVYTSSARAIELYTRKGFVIVSDPIPDPDQDGATYIVMAQRVSLAPA